MAHVVTNPPPITLDEARQRAALTIDEAAHLHGVSRPTIYAMVKRGELRLHKIGRSSRLNARQVLALIGEEVPADGAA